MCKLKKSIETIFKGFVLVFTPTLLRFVYENGSIFNNAQVSTTILDNVFNTMINITSTIGGSMIFLGVMRMAFTFILDVPKEQNVKKAETYLQSIDTSFAVNDNDLRKQYSNELEKFRAELDEYKIRLSSYAKEYHDIPMGKSLQESLEVLELIKEHTSLEECQRGNLSKLNSQYLPAVIALLEQYKNLSSFKNTTIKVKAVLKELSDTVIASKTVFTNILEEAIADEKLNAEVDSKIFLNTAVQNGLYADRNTLVMRQTEDEDK